MLEIFTAVCGLIQSILIMFKRKENWIFYLLNIVSLTSNWYPIITTKQLAMDVRVVGVNSQEEIVDYLTEN